MSEWTELVVDDDAGLRAILRTAKSVAVIGAKIGAHEPAYYVPAYLAARGYRIHPVNPKLVGETIHGVRVVGSLAELAGSVDVIEIFRRRSSCPATPARSSGFAGDLRPCGSSSASGTTRRPRRWRGRESRSSRIAA